MENFFDNQNGNLDLKRDNFDFNISGNARVTPSGNTSLPAKAAVPRALVASDFTSTDRSTSTSRQRLEDERIRRENQNAFFGIQRKKDIDCRDTEKQAQPDLYGTSMQKTQDRADPEKLKWNWSGREDDIFRPRPGEHAHNAVLKGLQAIGQLPEIANPQALSREKVSLEDTTLSFQLPEESRDRKAELRKRIENFPDFLEASAQSARNHEDNVSGFSAYQNGHRTGINNTSDSDYLNNANNWYAQPEGKFANVIGLGLAKGVLDTPAAKVVDMPGQGINNASQSFGADKVTDTLADYSRHLDEIAGIHKEDATFITRDGRKTGWGMAADAGYTVSEHLPTAAFMTLAASEWGADKLAAGVIPVNVEYAYLRKHQEILDQLNELPQHLLSGSREIMAHFDYEQMFEDNPRKSLGRAKRAVARKYASLHAGVETAKELLGLKLSRVTAEDKESALWDITKGVSIDAIGSALGQYIMKAVENGSIVHEGETAY